MTDSNRVRALRAARGLSQGELAVRSGLSRQSVSAIEAARATPGVDVAMRLARALDTTVEALFSQRPLEAVDAVAAGPVAPGERVALARIDGRWVAHALRGEGARLAADGVLAAPRRGTRVRARTGSLSVDLLSSSADAQDNIVMMGCAPGLGLLADRLNARGGPGRFLWIARSSAAALDALAQRSTHLSGVHIVDADGREANVAAAREVAHVGPLTVVTFARWQEGLVMREADRARIRGVADLVRKDVRVVAREAGAGAQRLLERAMTSAGVPKRFAQHAPVRAAGHLDVARVIAQGGADVGIATADAARAFGLHFVPLADERYDLIIPSALLADARLARLFDMLASQPFRRDLDAVGYDTRFAGQTVAQVHA
jgi:putative molybdopterin biosynthesis protein